MTPILVLLLEGDELMDLIVRDARILRDGELVNVDIAVEGKTIAAIAPALAADGPELKAEGCLVVPGLIETHSGGRVAVGHVTQMSLLPPERFNEIATRLADAGVAVTILPSTDLHLMGRSHDHAVPRGVVQAEPLRKAGVTCSISTNNVLNPFTPYGDGSLIRMANL